MQLKKNRNRKIKFSVKMFTIQDRNEEQEKLLKNLIICSNFCFWLIFQIKETEGYTKGSAPRFKIQKQPPRGVNRKKGCENMQQIYRRSHKPPKYNFNKVAL